MLNLTRSVRWPLVMSVYKSLVSALEASYSLSNHSHNSLEPKSTVHLNGKMHFVTSFVVTSLVAVASAAVTVDQTVTQFNDLATKFQSLEKTASTGVFLVSRYSNAAGLTIGSHL